MKSEPSETRLARHHSPYTLREKVGRVLWSACEATLFRASWPTWYRYRNWLLRRFGAKVDPKANFRRTVRVTCPWNLTVGPDTSVGDHARLYCLGPVTLGERTTVSQHAHLCAGSHDHTHPDMPLLRLPITLENDVWVASDAFVGPGVTAHEGALLGARGCAFKNLDAWTVYGGNPAQALKPRPRHKF